MELKKVCGEYETVELAELAAGRIRRTVQGIRHITVQPLGRAEASLSGHTRYTMLPANMRMQNYATAVMVSEISDDVVPEPFYRRTAEVMVLCDEAVLGRVVGLLQATGAVHLQKSR